MWYGRWSVVLGVSKGEGEDEGDLWCIVVDVGIWYVWKSDFGKLVEYIECLWF